MSLNPNGTQNYNWNYSRPNDEGYSLELVGTVLAIQEVQGTVYEPFNQGPRKPAFWPDGNPKFNIRIALATPEGQLKTLVFQPAGKAARQGKKPSLHMMLWALTGNTNMTNLIGKTIKIATAEGTYGSGNPRPWGAEIAEGGPYELNNMELPEEYKVPRVLCDTAASGGQIQQPMQQTRPMMQQPMMQQQPAYPQPQPMQQMAQPQPMMQQAQPMMQQPVQQQPMQQAQSLPAGYPQGMDPSVAAAMQQMGVTKVETVQQAGPVVGTVYDEDIPF